MRKLEDYTDEELQQRLRKSTTETAIGNILKEIRRRNKKWKNTEQEYRSKY